MSDLSAAFPAALHADAAEVLRAIPHTRLESTQPFVVGVGGEAVSIPYRSYNEEPSSAAVGALSRTRRLMLACLYTRHHNGHVRQSNLRVIAEQPHPWIAPFVVQLVGEYVVEIILDVRDFLVGAERPESELRAIYQRFAAQNRRFLDSTYQRAASYWDCYYRNLYATRRHYPAFDVLDLLRGLAREAH